MNIFRPIQEEMQETPEFKKAAEELAQKRLSELEEDQKFSAPQPEGEQELTEEEKAQEIKDNIKKNSF